MPNLAHDAMMTLGTGVRTLRTHALQGWHRVGRVADAPGGALFLRQYLARPRTVGSVWPSSGWLARVMVRSLPQQREGLVIELGAGTGAVTRALLAGGVAPERLRVLERTPAFVRHLRQQFPGLAVMQDDASRLAELLPAGVPVAAIVSSLPLRAMARDEVAAIVRQWRQVLAPGALVVQYTYALCGDGSGLGAGFREREHRFVWRNLPPARVSWFERTPGDPVLH